jgi:Cep192 domain 4
MNQSSTVATVLAVVALFAGEAALGHAVEAQATLSLTPATQDFGSVALGQTSAVVVFTVVNRGTSPTKGLSLGLGGNGASNFAITVNNCGAALSPGGTCAVSVNFAPRSIGAKAATLDLKSNPGGMVRSNLSGTGNSGLLTCSTGQTMQNGVCVYLTGTTTCPTGQTMQNGVCVNLTTGTTTCPTGMVYGPGGCTMMTLSVGPLSRDFGSVPTGTASTSFTFTVVNTSTVSVSGISVVVSGVNASSFVIASSTCASLPAGGTCGVAVRFSPSSVGTRTASLDVTATMSGGASAGLTGTAIP